MQLTSLETLIETDGREILRLMLEEHIGLRGSGAVGESIAGSDEVVRTHRRLRTRSLKTIFGPIDVERMQYSLPRHTSLAPKDALLNLPENSYSHSLQQRVSTEIAKGSFDEAIASVKIQTGVKIPKRQAEELAKEVAKDFDDFYAKRSVLALREATERAFSPFYRRQRRRHEKRGSEGAHEKTG